MSEARLKELKRHLKGQPEDPFLYHALGVENNKLGKTKAAIGYFKQALALDPGYLGSYYQLGKCLEKEQLYQEALTTYIKGMNHAHEQGDRHTYLELRQAYELLEEDLEE